MEQHLVAGAGVDAHGHDRVEGAAGDGGEQRLLDDLEADLLPAEVAVEEGVVLGLLDDPLEEGPVVGVEEPDVLLAGG